MTGARDHAIGVCTFRRPGLVRTLASLEAQKAPTGALTIIVADNDDTPSAQAAVEDFARTSRHEVIHIHAPARNISVARNAILAAARERGHRVLAFIDDDEVATQNWLPELLAPLADGLADAVFGPVRADYSRDAPAWLGRARSHDTIPETLPDGSPKAGHTCNVAMDLRAPAFEGLLFGLDRGRTGGEDTAFFHEARRRGARLAVAPEAEVVEEVPPGRATLRWLLRRRYRMGQTHGSLLAEEGSAGRAAIAAAKLCWCAGAALLALPVPARRNAALIRGALHAGVVAEAAGLRPVAPYGNPSAEGGRKTS